MKDRPVSTSLVVALVSGLALLAGTLLPWLFVTTDSGVIAFTGIQLEEQDFILTLGAGALIVLGAGVALARRRASEGLGVLILFVGVAAAVVSLEWVVTFFVDGNYSTGVVGAGLWLTVAGSVLAAAAGVATLIGFAKTSAEPSKPWAGIVFGLVAAFVVVVAADAIASQIASGQFSQISPTLD